MSLLTSGLFSRVRRLVARQGENLTHPHARSGDTVSVVPMWGMVAKRIVQTSQKSVFDPKTDIEWPACALFYSNVVCLNLFGIAFSRGRSDEKIHGVVYGFWA